MTTFPKEHPYSHGSAPKIGILIINLGSPSAPTPQSVRTYLREFLSDPYVVEIPKPIWWLILNLFILTTRPKDSAHRYAQVWTDAGSPLKVHTEQQAIQLAQALELTLNQPHIVDYAMRYGSPSIAEKINALKAANCDRILLLPLYPQYSASTTGTVFQKAYSVIGNMRNQPALRTVKHFHDDPVYIQASADNIRQYWAQHGQGEHLLFSFHGVPRRTLDLGDPYHCECLKTGRLIAENLGLKAGTYTIGFQSRFGRAEWLKPYTADLLPKLATQGTARLDIVCPGFVSDCLETLEEIAIEARAIFLNAGGQSCHYIPCLNESEVWIGCLANLALQHTKGWQDTDSKEDLIRSRRAALALNAPQ